MLDIIRDRNKVLIIDATRMNREPGAIQMFHHEEVSLVVKEDHLSLHGIGLAEALSLGESLELLPENLKFIGIQPLSVNVGNELSAPVRAAIEPIITTVLAELDSLLVETEAYRGTGGTVIA